MISGSIFMFIGLLLAIGSYIYIRKFNIFDYKNSSKGRIKIKYWIIHFFELEILLLYLGIIVFLLGIALALGEI
ncbi:hypothetical protein GCM10011391_14470 [Pullulanibacillus camelliae]|uniref:Uncharacterized protein n=1 Tax=Pullulanibacillus camelliae TaxID=1707096 RepID=A0A8J2VVF0_9BACL|nr:hypothetical protein GCM10011391_14470 [Pullulanibacillus camelliae]